MEALKIAGVVSAVLGTALTFCGAGVVMRPAATATPGPVDAGTVPAGGGTVPAGGGTAPFPGTEDGSPPVHLEIPALAVRARVRPVGVRPDGTLQVPASARDLGWWRGGASPGSATGTVVVAGHVDTAAEGPGALFELARLPLGSRVRVRSVDGRTRDYLTVARRVYPKPRLPASVFAQEGPPRLALITCTGAFDRRSASYSDNLVVYATGV